MLNKIKNLLKSKKAQKVDNDWYADYKMEDGQTGRAYDMWDVMAVEKVAYDRGHKSVWFSVKGGEWFDSFKAPEN